MKSITYKLAMIFLVMSVVSLIIGFGGAFVLQTARKSLDDNNSALENLARLLSAARDSLADNARLQENANQVTGRIAGAQEDTYTALKEMGDVMLPKSFAIAQMRFALADLAAAERALLLALNMRHLDMDELRTTREIQLANIAQSLNTMTGAITDYRALLQEDDDRQAWQALEASLNEWRDNHEDFMREIANLDALVDDLVRGGPLFASASRKAYDTAFVRGKSIRETCEKRIETLNQAIAKSAEVDVQRAMGAQDRSRALVADLGRESTAAVDNAKRLGDSIAAAGLTANAASESAALALAATTARFWYLVVLSALGIVGAFILGMTLSLRISRPVRNIADQMARIARGDLTATVQESALKRNDEIGQLARAMQDLLAATHLEVRMANAMASGDYTHYMPIRSSEDQLGRALGVLVQTTNAALSQVSQAVDRVGNGAAAVSEASRSLSQGAQTSASAVEEIALTVNHVDVQAKDNAAHAHQANELATASRDAAKRGYSAVSELVGSMGEIQESGRRIATVAKLIDDIAFQTNLLALNAAVEAARAGRHGKGFSVVADEVRNLSGRSAKAARETSAMVAAMTQRMEAGSQLAERTDHEFREIVDATEKVAELFQEITTASYAQSTAMAQISQGLAQIDSVIQENTHNAGRTATSALGLSRQAERLRSMVARFRLLSFDRKGASPAEKSEAEQRERPASLETTKRPLLSFPSDGEEKEDPPDDDRK